MKRVMVDCRDHPSESNCSLAFAGDESDFNDLVELIVAHAVAKHGHEDTPETRSVIMSGFKESTQL